MDVRPVTAGAAIDDRTTDARPVAVRIRSVHKSFDGHVALERIDLDVYAGEFLSLLGPSGCGKTTLLRIIAGFEEPDDGEVLLDGRDAVGVPPYRRPVNTVFQSYALFPHMTVAQNVEFGLRMARVPKREATERAERAMELVEIASFAGRRPNQLSGGQRQRVALARAIVNEPSVLLLDEPLGALDLKLRKQLQVELMQLQRRLGMTFVYVTHDQEEALVMSDRIAVMRTGAIDQLDAVDVIYERPRTRYVASFLGASNLFEGSVRSTRGSVTTVATPHGDMEVELPLPRTAGAVTLSVRPEKMRLARPGDALEPDAVAAPGRIEEIVYTGAENQFLVRANGELLYVYAMNRTSRTHDAFAVGDDVVVSIPHAGVVALED